MDVIKGRQVGDTVFPAGRLRVLLFYGRLLHAA